MRIGRIFFLIVIVLCVFEMARLWNIMPDQMAAHFNLQGDADRFVPKAEFFRFQLQTMLIVILISLPLQWMVSVIPPTLIKMPNREYWLAPEHRAEMLGRIGDFGSILFGIILLALQAACDIAAYANLRTPILFNAALMGKVMTVSVLAIVLALIGLIVSFRLPTSLD